MCIYNVIKWLSKEMNRRKGIKIFLTRAINITSGEGSAKNNSPDGEKKM